MLRHVYKILAGAAYQTYKDTSFVVGDSPATHDINTDLGRNAVQVFIYNDGIGDMDVEMTQDGSTWGDKHTMKSLERLELRDVDVDSVRVTHVADTAYRILAL